MTILVCHNHYALRAGEDHAVAAQCALLRAHGHTVELYTRDNAEIAGWPWWRKLLAIVTAFYNPRTVREILELAARVRPDVAHVHNVFPLLSPSVFVALRRARVPVVYSAHNFRCVCANGLLFRDGRPCHDCLAWRYLACVRGKCFRDSRAASLWYAAIIWWHRRRRTLQRHVQRLIALNHFSRSIFLQAGFREQQCVVLPNFADERYDTTVDTPEPYVLFAGRLSDEKGVMTVIDAAAQVPELQVRIAGSGPREADVRARITTRKLTNVILLGQLPSADVAHAISHALALIFPSECYENCPLVVINALWAGTPVIAARTGGVPEFVPEGTAGWLFAPGNSDELAARLRWLVAHRAEAAALRPRARAWARQQFDPAQHLTRLEQIYHEAIVAVQEP